MSTTPPPDTLTAALAWHAAGASVVRVATDGTKRPIGGWKQAQAQRADEQQLHAWFGHGHPGIGLVLGEVSGHLEMLEFEGRAVTEGVAKEFGEICEASGLGPLWDMIKRGYCERTPSGGYHLIYSVLGGPVLPNTKLASRPSTPDELATNPQKTRPLIETRGEGGFVVVAPSSGACHETGRPWELLAGGPATVAEISADERDALFDIARMLDQMPEAPAPEQPAAAAERDQAAAFLLGMPTTSTSNIEGSSGAITPLDDYEQRTSWADILKPHGWQLVGTIGHTSYWRRPGKTVGVSATTGRDPQRDRLFVFTSSTEFTPETPYTKPGAYAVLEHGGDYSAAARALRRQGYGTPAERPRHLAVVPATTPAAPTPPPVDGTAALQVEEPPTHARGTAWPESFTDDGNALLFAHTFNEQLRYVPQRGAWLTWDGHRWAWDDTGRTIELARGLVRDLDLSVFDEDMQKAARKHRNASLSRTKITAMLGLAQSDQRLAVPATRLDAAPRHLNTPGGIVSLADGTIAPSDPAALHTRSTSVAPDPTLPTPRWHAFLADTFGGDQDLIGFVQRLAGYSASADTGTHVFPFLHGPGGNGKSVLMDVLRHLLGDYAAPAPAGFLMVGRQEHSEELARLQGLRLVVASEINPDARFDEAKLKELTGGDTLTARFMHQSFFEFEPTHHLWLMGNHQPRVKSGGDSFWRRLRLIPFQYKVPEAKKVDGLADILVAEEGPGILAWIIQGAVAHFAHGLREPDSVKAATAAYAAEEDHIGRFLEECCTRGPATQVRTETGRVRAAYEQWCHSEGETPMDARTFGRELKARGIVRKPSSGRYFYAGLGLAAEGDADQPRAW
ncbi:phage/plasmid primase, P4 family [Streptomyces sp. NPDC014806]|uniref:phage/plasmid primase, P4 family n=1 Tax=Streptomyces sp. NPDC014806 TaxID=3364920 RepID=UPI0036F6E9AA